MEKSELSCVLVIQGVFWLSVFLLLANYGGYPLFLAFMSFFKTKPFASSASEDEELPTVTLLVCAYNEEGVIGQKIENSLLLAYPAEKLEIIVISDGSTDQTDDIVRSFASQRVGLLHIVPRLGKTHALNEVIPRLKSEIIVFSDANSMLHADALIKLVRHFSSPAIGGVCGELRYTSDFQDLTATSEGAYWRYEKWIKMKESEVCTLTVFNGALYGIRRSLHQSMHPQAANDFQHALQVTLKGYKSVYEPEAIAWEDLNHDETTEFRRRVRIISRGWKGLSRYPAVLNPVKTRSFALQFMFRKLLRWLGPVLMLTAFLSNLLLLQHGVYRYLFVTQGVFYALALMGYFSQRFRGRSKLTYYPYYLCLINYAALLGLIYFLKGKNSATWVPTTHKATSSKTARPQK